MLCLAFMGLLLSATSASGEGRYVALQCYPGVGSADHSSAEFSGPARKFAREASCSDRGLGLHSPRRSPRGRHGQWTISAPKGTSFSYVSLQSQQRGAKGWRPAVDLVERGAGAVPIDDIPADGGWHSVWKSGSFDAVVARLGCAKRKRGSSASKGRRRTRSCRRTKRPFVYARQFEFRIADEAAPDISGLTGSLLGGGIRSGLQAASVTASDKGGGLRAVFLRVNGIPTANRGLPCDLTRMGAKTVADKLRPCPPSRSETLSVNASAAPFRPGENAVQACASDYSDSDTGVFPANTTCTAPRIVISNGGCDRVAATSGSDGNSGTILSPYRSGQKLADSLASGQRGCLRAGTFATNTAIEFRRPGITLTSAPGERATVRGLMKIHKEAHGVTVTNLNIDGRSPYRMGPMIYAANATFDNVDVTNYNTGICFLLGPNDPAFGRAINTVIQNSRIHHCGLLPAQNGDHGIYVAASSGAIIRNNWIYDNADRGIQLYPDSQGTQVYGNVIDGNGEGIIISGGGATASSNNLIRNNVISNSKIRWNVESNWPSRVGTGNVVRNNCLWASNSNPYYRERGGVLGVGPLGFTTSGNVIADPRYVSRFWKDFRLQAGSPCASTLG